MELMNEASEEYMKLKAESKSLKLTASDSLIKIFEELENLVQASKDSAHNLMKQLPKLIMSNNLNELSKLQDELKTHGETITMKSSELEKQMRFELNEIIDITKSIQPIATLRLIFSLCVRNKSIGW